MSENREKAKGNLNRLQDGEEWKGELRMVGVKHYTKGDQAWNNWWVMVRLITEFKGSQKTDKKGVYDRNVRFFPNDLVFSGIRGTIAIPVLKKIADEVCEEIHNSLWIVPDHKQVILHYQKVKSKKSGRFYYNLNYEVH